MGNCDSAQAVACPRRCTASHSASPRRGRTLLTLRLSRPGLALVSVESPAHPCGDHTCLLARGVVLATRDTASPPLRRRLSVAAGHRAALLGDLQGLSLSDAGPRCVASRATCLASTWLSLAGVLVVGLGMRLAVGRRLHRRTWWSNRRIQRRVRPHRPHLHWRDRGHRDVAGGAAHRDVDSGAIRTACRSCGRSDGASTTSSPTPSSASGRGTRLLLVVFLFELVTGFLGFFSDFRTVVIMTALAALAQPGALRGTEAPSLVAIVGVVGMAARSSGPPSRPSTGSTSIRVLPAR